MIDFINNYYYEDYSAVEGMDKEKAKKKAFSTVLPIIMQEELTPMQSGSEEHTSELQSQR